MPRSLVADCSRKRLYTCDATVETTEPTATPITDPAMPICADSSIDVTAASAPAVSCAPESPSNRLFAVNDVPLARSVIFNLVLIIFSLAFRR